MKLLKTAPLGPWPNGTALKKKQEEFAMLMNTRISLCCIQATFKSSLDANPGDYERSEFLHGPVPFCSVKS